MSENETDFIGGDILTGTSWWKLRLLWGAKWSESFQLPIFPVFFSSEPTKEIFGQFWEFWLNSLNQCYFISRIKPLKGLNLVGFFWKIMSSIFYRRINYRIRKFIEDNMLFISIFETFFKFFDSFWLIFGKFWSDRFSYD